MKIQRPRGTHDLYGKDAKRFRFVYDTARQVFEYFGFEELQTPFLEEKELFVRALGNETDVVQKEMYELEDRSGLRLALRPEGTAGIVRAYLENNFDKTEKLSKFYYSGAMFRSERPQKGRQRQFHQVGVEELGTMSPCADAEVIHCLTSLLDRLGIKGYELKINNLGTFEDRKAFQKALFKYFTPLQASLCADCQRRLESNVLRLLDCKVGSCRKLAHDSPLLNDYLQPSSQSHYAQVCQLLDEAGILYTQDRFIVRGLDYYTKTVFEVSHANLGAQDAVAAGGRYDSLIETFGGSQGGAVGFAVGVERLLMLVEETASSADEYESACFIAVLGEVAFKEGLRLLFSLRKNQVKTAMDFESKSLKSQMRTADKIKSRFVIIIGEDEIKARKFNLKDMKNGSQETLDFDSIIPELQKRL